MYGIYTHIHIAWAICCTLASAEGGEALQEGSRTAPGVTEIMEGMFEWRTGVYREDGEEIT